jgi:hypothetical protein
MRNYFKLIGPSGLILFSFVSALSAQTTINGGRVITGAWDASNSASSKPAKTGTALPQTCGVGEQFFKTDASQGQNLYFCTAQDTWIQMTGGGTGTGSSGGSSNPSVLLFKGDLSGFANQNVRIPVGPDGSNLTADSTQGSGLRYRNASDSNTFANRPVCTAALTGETYYPTDGILGYRCNGVAWTGFGPIAPITPMRVNGNNSYGVLGTGSSVLTTAATSTGALTLLSCQTFPTTVGMVLVDSEVIAGTCTGTTFTPITGGRGYNQTTAASHNPGASVIEQLFVWGNTRSGTSLQATSTVAAGSGYLAFTTINGNGMLPVLAKPIPNGPSASYTVTGGFILNGASSVDQGCGIGFRQSSNDNEAFVMFHSITYSQTGFTLGQYTFTDASYTGAYFADLAAATMTGNGMYFRLQDTLSQRNVYVSSDGINFVLVHSVTEGDFLSPDQIVVSCTGGSVAQMASFFSWTETN